MNCSYYLWGMEQDAKDAFDCLAAHLCPEAICQNWVAGKPCCGAVAEQALEKWKARGKPAEIPAKNPSPSHRVVPVRPTTEMFHAVLVENRKLDHPVLVTGYEYPAAEMVWNVMLSQMKE